MNLSKTLILLCSFLFCILTVSSDKIKRDDKIKLQIELINKDELLSSPHLKIKKSILHNGKKINIRLFEKINENVLERAYIVEEVDKTKSLTADEKKELLTLKNENSEEEEDTETNEEETEIENEDDGKMKLISTEESKENDIHMIRKVYKETKGNKEITYCYMIFTFNLDLDKMNEVSKSELFKSLDSMPDYLSFLSPNEKVSDTENLLEEEYEQTENGTGTKSRLGGISAAELSHESEDIKINIAKYIRTFDNIINYLVGKLEKSAKYPEFYNELISEREYLYNLSLEKTENEDVVNGEYWKNKSKIEKYILYEVLTRLSTIYFSGMIKKTSGSELDSVSEYNKFVDLIKKSMECHSVLDNTEILDIIILQKLNKVEENSDNQNKVDKDLIQQCLSLFKLLLNNKEEYPTYKKHEAPFNNENEIESELNKLSEEEFPTEKYILRKETSEIDDLIKPTEEDSSKSYENDEDLDLMDTDITEDEDEEEYEDELDEIDAEALNDEIETEATEENEEDNDGSFLENDDKIINSDISTEMFNEDPEIADETEDEHKNEILDVIHLEEQKMLEDDINSPIEKDIKPHNEINSSYLEKDAMTEDDDDDDEEVEEEDEDMFSLDDDDDDDIFSNDETDEESVSDDTTEDNESVEDVEEDEDDDDADSEEESSDLDDNDNDDDDNDEESSSGNFTDKIKKSLKKEFKNVLNSGKEMGKNALSNLVDKAEGQVQKLTSKMSKKLKNKLNGKKDKKSKKEKKEKKEKKAKKTKKGKKEVEGKSEKKSNSKENKKTKKSDKTDYESNDEVVKKSSTPKPKNKKKNTSTSSKKSNSNKKLRKSDKRKGAFISLTTESNKVPLSGKMNRTLAKITEEMSSLKAKQNKLLRDLEKPTVSDKKIIDDFEKYEDENDNKKGAHIRKLKSDKKNCA